MNTTINKVLWAVGTVIVAILLAGMFFGSKAVTKAFGSAAAGITNLTGLSIISMDGYTGMFDVSGSGTGTQFQRMNGGTCYIQAYATTIAASTTALVDCQATAAVGGITTANDTALTGVTFGDNVIANLSTTTAQSGTTGNLGLVVTGVSASTTSGYITLKIANMNGTTFTWPLTGAATGTASYFVTK